MVDKDCGDPVAKSLKMSSALDQLKQYTTVVADTGDFEGRRNLGLPFCFKNLVIRRTVLHDLSVLAGSFGYCRTYNPSGYTQDGPEYNAFRCFSLFRGRPAYTGRTVLRITSAYKN